MNKNLIAKITEALAATLSAGKEFTKDVITSVRNEFRINRRKNEYKGSGKAGRKRDRSPYSGKMHLRKWRETGTPVCEFKKK